MCVVSTAVVLLLSAWGCGCGSEGPGDIEDASVVASLDAKTDAGPMPGPQPEREWLPWPDASTEDAFVWVPPDACLEPEDNPNVIVLPPDGTKSIYGFMNSGDYVVYSMDMGVTFADVFYFSVSDAQVHRVTERNSAQNSPYVYGEEIIFEDRQFYDADNDIYNVELFHFDITTGIETRLTEDDVARIQVKFNSDFLLYLSNETCPQPHNHALTLKNRHTEEITILADCGQSPETHSISEHFAAWSARPYPGHNKDIFVRDLAGETTIHLESTGPGSQYSPHTDDNYMVWEDSRDGRREIYMYNLSTGVEECLTPDPWEQVKPTLRNGVAAWCDHRHSQEWGGYSKCDVYVYDMETGAERRVTDCSEVWLPGFVDSGWIMYGKWITGEKIKLYVHDLVAEGILDTEGRVIP